MRLIFGAVIALLVSVSTHSAETITRSVSILGLAKADQTVAYYPSQSAYKAQFEATKTLLDAGDPAGCVNPADGPNMHVVTNAQVGLTIKGIGAFEGKEHVRRITAAEEALYIHEKEGGKTCG